MPEGRRRAAIFTFAFAGQPDTPKAPRAPYMSPQRFYLTSAVYSVDEALQASDQLAEPSHPPIAIPPQSSDHTREGQRRICPQHIVVSVKLDLRAGSGRPACFTLLQPALLCFFFLTGSDHAVNDYVPFLPDTVGSVHGLHVVGGVPGRVEQDHAVCPG